MPLCPNGSQAKSTTPPWLVVAGTALELLITRRFPWLGVFLAFLPTFAVDTSEFCANEPAAMPTWEPADLVGIFTGQASAKIAQTIDHVAWYEFCECINATTPAIPVVGPPQDIPVVQPNPIGDCDEVHADYFSNTMPGQGIWVVGSATDGRQLPVGATHLEITGVVIADGQPSPYWTTRPNLETYFLTLAGVATGAATICGLDPQNNVYSCRVTATIPADAVKWRTKVQTQGGGFPTDRHVTLDVRALCGGLPERLSERCCPPDPALIAKVDSLLDLVTLVQRQGVPVAYVPAGETAGLQGSGELQVDQLLAVSVLLTTVPAHYGFAEGDPDRLFDVGWLAPGTADGFEAPRRIRTSPFLMRLSGDHTRVGYSLAPGVVATMRRHSREP